MTKVIEWIGKICILVVAIGIAVYLDVDIFWAICLGFWAAIGCDIWREAFNCFLRSRHERKKGKGYIR